MNPIYREDPYRSDCETKVERILAVEQGQAIFCRDGLFMSGGGQPMDHGYLILNTIRYPLLSIVKEKGNTGYVIAADATAEKGMIVNCELDHERRLKIMRLHSAQHALAGALRLVRPTILTGGMQIADDLSHCSVQYPASSELKESDLDSALRSLEDMIQEGRSITSETVQSELDAQNNHRNLYRPTIASGSLKGKIRLIIIDGLDVNACGGTHVRNLKEVGVLNLLKVIETASGSDVHFSVL